MTYDPTDPLRNPLDPIHGSGPDAAMDLFRRVSRAAHHLPTDAVIDAACTLLINAIRQSAPDWRQAEPMFDQYFSRTKSLLHDHYDANGRKRGVFPFNQTVAMNGPINDKDRSFSH